MKSAALPPPGTSCRTPGTRRSASATCGSVCGTLSHRPRSLAAYITTVTRRLALDKCDYNRAAQRRSDLTVAFEELEGCLPAEDGAVRALEQQEFRRVLNGFLRKLTRQSRTYFVRRYWYGESIREIADSCGAGEEKVKSSLFRTRQRLRTVLEKEGML